MFSFSFENLLNQYSVYAIPFIIIIGGVMLSKFNVGRF